MWREKIHSGQEIKARPPKQTRMTSDTKICDPKRKRVQFVLSNMKGVCGEKKIQDWWCDVLWKSPIQAPSTTTLTVRLSRRTDTWCQRSSLNVRPSSLAEDIPVAPHPSTQVQPWNAEAVLPNKAPKTRQSTSAHGQDEAQRDSHEPDLSVKQSVETKKAERGCFFFWRKQHLCEQSWTNVEST